MPGKGVAWRSGKEGGLTTSAVMPICGAARILSLKTQVPGPWTPEADTSGPGNVADTRQKTTTEIY